MSELVTTPEQAVLVQAGEPTKNKKAQPSLEELLDSLRSAQNDIGQIAELNSEEKTVIYEFFESFLKLMRSYNASINVSVEQLPDNLGDVTLASFDPTGKLMLMYSDGHMILVDLQQEENRDLLTAVLTSILPMLKQLFSARREKIEKRLNFILSITKEVQKMSQAISKAIT